MKKTVISFGLISGGIVSAVMMVTMILCYKQGILKNGMLIGYSSMLLAFAFVFVGVKNFRDKHNNGVLTFGKGFMTGFYIALIASTLYVITWMIEFHFFIPDFMDKYAEHMIQEATEKGADAAELSKQMAEADKYREMYKNPFFVMLLTYCEILPLGVIIALISALILKKKPKAE